MAAPFRSACVSRCLRSYYLVLKQSTHRQYQLSASSRRSYANKSQEDFYGIEADLQSSKDPSVTSLTADGESDVDLEALLQPMRKRRKKSMEVRLQTSFGEVRLDKTAKQPYLETLNPEQFWKVVHSEHQSLAGSNTNTNSAVAKETRQAKPQKQKRDKRSRTTVSASFGTSQAGNAQNKTARNKEQSYDDLNYFDEVYFGQGHSMDPPVLKPAAVSEAEFPDVVTDHKHEALNTSEAVRHKSKHTQNQYTRKDPSNDSTELSTSHSLFDEEYFSSVLDKAEHPPVFQKQSSHSDSSFIDQQYFPDTATSESPNSKQFRITQQNKTSEAVVSSEEFNFIDTQYVAASESGVSGHSPSFDHMINQYNVTEGERTAQEMPPYRQNKVTNEEMDSQRQTKLEEMDSQRQTKLAKETKQAVAVHGQPFTERSGDPPAQEFLTGLAADSAQTVVRQRRISRGQLQSVKASETTPAAESRGKVGKGPAKQAAVSDKEAAVSNKEAAVSNKEAAVSDKEAVVSDKEAAVSDKEAAVSDKETAYDVAMKIRKGFISSVQGGVHTEGEQSAEKQRLMAILEQVPNIYNMPSLEITRLLADSVIFENEDFIALSKPYGLPSHGGPSVRVSVGQLLEPLARHLDKGRGQLATLHLVHRLDKETTGVMLLAKNAEVAWRLLGMFRRREVKKKYWAVTKGVPQPLEGIVDIPLARQKVHGIFKTTIQPETFVVDGQVRKQKWSRRDDRSMEAITEYEVLAQQDSMALVELRPLSGVQHQIRAHLAQALNAPILGDHKYSHMDKLAPQRLFPEALQKLGIRQAQVRYLPMHLHAKSLVLPEWRGRNNVFINAVIPKFFLRSLKTLKIKIPKA
ncbi:hypothetical protein BaRGS_00038475 [Batillaria attramentaria]|uniref:Pseudouridylate synthase RPUSD4, mitochondrial n=1 Tax=Batillaria attramentaria TaxID=370345 RepID=A0ABD0J5N0_9CAEN